MTQAEMSRPKLAFELPAPIVEKPSAPQQRLPGASGLQLNSFGDLKLKHPPTDPVVLHQRFQSLRTTPASQSGTNLVQYRSETGTTDREGCWLWWQELARVGLFVDQL